MALHARSAAACLAMLIQLVREGKFRGKNRAVLAEIILADTFVLHPVAQSLVAEELGRADGLVYRMELF